MKVFAENENNDIYIGSNNQIAIDIDLEAVLQACQAAIEIRQGEALYSQENGIPYENVVWNGTPNLQQFEFFIRKQILKVVDVINITDFSVTSNDNILKYQITIETSFGTGEING